MTALPQRMRAIEIAAPGGPEQLRLVERPTPLPASGEVLIRVAAAGVNRPDVIQRLGHYAPPPGTTDIPGLEVAGTIVAVGPGTRRWTVGDPVCALLSGGGYADYAVAPAGQCLPIPAGLSPVEAAGLPETLFTVWHNLFERGWAAEGDTVLVHGGSSGIGVAAIQLAKAWDLRIAVTAGSDEKCFSCRDLGADLAINYKAADFVEAIRDWTGGRGVDVVIDMVGGDYVPRNLACLADGGRHVSIAVQRGLSAEINLFDMMRRRLTLTGSTLRNRSATFKAALAESIEQEVWPLLASGRIRSIIDSTFPLAEAAKAHARMESSAHFGKIVLSADPISA